jgi:membrane protease YdiL (CAAX protease family)
MTEPNHTPAPAGFAFLEQAGPKDRSWWRALLLLFGGGLATALVFVVLVSVSFSIGSLGLMAVQDLKLEEAVRRAMTTRTDQPLITYLPVLFALGVSFIGAVATFVAIASWIYGRPIKSFLTAAPRFRWRAVLAGLLVTTPLMLVAILFEVQWNPPEATPPMLRLDEAFTLRLLYALAAAGFLYLAALAEEVIFRGWLLQQLKGLLRNPWVVLVVSGLLFSLAHADPNVDAFVARAAMGVAWGWIVLRTGGIEFASGGHLANNLMIALFLAPITLETPTATAFQWGSLLVQCAVLFVLVGVVEWARRRPALALRMGISS